MADRARRTAVATLAGLGALLLTAPTPRTAVVQLASAGTGPDPTGPLVAAVALLAWAVTAWLALTVALVLLSRVPGALGRVVRLLADRMAPAAVRRGVEAALGLTVAVGVVAPTAALAAPPPIPIPTSAAVPSDDAWDLDWPSRPVRPTAGATGTPSAVAPTPVPVRSAAATPAPSGTASPPAPSTPAPSTPAPVRPTPPRAAAPPIPAVPTQPAAGSLVVRSGDSLWSIAEASLRRAGTAHPTDRQVAQAWPRWWAANREAVGDDPDLLLPGTVLRPPAAPGAT